MRTATVNEGLVRGLVNDIGARNKFPFLKNAYKLLNPSKKSCCGRVARASLNVKTVKNTILGMPESELKKLKAHLGVEKLVFFTPKVGGGTTKTER